MQEEEKKALTQISISRNFLGGFGEEMKLSLSFLTLPQRVAVNIKDPQRR